MRYAFWIVVLLLLAVVGGVATVWALQNADQVAVLRLDLGSGLGLAWAMREPMSVPLLMLAAFGVGFAAPGLGWFSHQLLLKARIRNLQRTLDGPGAL